MIIELNIGLATTRRPSGIIGGDEALAAIPGFVSAHRVIEVTHAHGTEKTLVARASVLPGDLERRIAVIANQCGQDCIACYVPSWGRGFLAGPKPYDEGFNPAYFVRA